MNTKYTQLQEAVHYTITSKKEFEKKSSDGSIEKSYCVRENDKEYKVKLEKEGDVFVFSLFRYEPNDEAWVRLKRIEFGDKEAADKKFDNFKDIVSKKLNQTSTQKKVVVQELLGMGHVPIVDDVIGLATGTVDAVTSNLAKSIKGIHNSIVDEPAGSPAVQQAQQQIAEKSSVMKFLQANKTNALIAGGLVGGGLLAAAGVKIYKNFFSKNAQLCGNSPNKAECMKQLKINALKQSIASLQKAKGAYGSLPEQYKQQAYTRIDNQIKVLNDRINIIAVNK